MSFGPSTHKEALEEIDLLQAEIDRLRAALERLIQDYEDETGEKAMAARKALAKEEGK